MKGHSVTTKQCSDGRVDSLQTLHNLEQGLIRSDIVSESIFIGCFTYWFHNIISCQMSLLVLKKTGKLTLTKFCLDGAMASIYLTIQV